MRHVAQYQHSRCDRYGGNPVLSRLHNSRALKRVVEIDSGVFVRTVVLLLLATKSLLAAEISDDDIVLFDIPQQQAVLSLIEFAEQACA